MTLFCHKLVTKSCRWLLTKKGKREWIIFLAVYCFLRRRIKATRAMAMMIATTAAMMYVESGPMMSFVFIRRRP